MKKFIPLALAALLLVPAAPAATQQSSATPTPTPTATTAAGPTQIYAGAGATRGLSLTLAGQGLLTGITDTHIASDTTDDCAGVACASAAGAAEPLGTTVTATSPGEGNPDPVQAGNLDPFEGALAGEFGEASAMTTTTPSATGTANGLNASVTLNQTILGQLPAEITGPLNDGLTQLGDALQPVADGDPTGAISGVTDTLASLITDLQSRPLLTVQGGQSTSATSIAGETVTTTTTAGGAIIVLLPTPESTVLLPEGLAVIEVGSSSASATADGTNPATGEATGSIARITLLPGILDALPDINPGEAEGLPLDELLGLVPEPIVDLLPEELTGLLGGGGSTEEPTATPTPTPTSTDTEGGPLDDILPTSVFLQADEDSGGFVIDLNTGTETTCILEDTPLATCITLGGTSQTVSENGLGIGVLAAGVDVSLLRDENGVGQVELSVARSEAGAAAEFVTPPPTPTPTPTPQTGMPDTGGGTTFVVPALAMMVLGGTALFGMRRKHRS